jgi:hypothetical protein
VEFEDIGHSKSARELLEQLVIGFLEGEDQTGKLMKNPFTTMSFNEREIHERLDKMLDISKPLLPQVRKMTNREFLAFVSRPRYIESRDGI